MYPHHTLLPFRVVEFYQQFGHLTNKKKNWCDGFFQRRSCLAIQPKYPDRRGLWPLADDAAKWRDRKY